MELALYADTITQDYDIWRQRRVKNQLTPPIDDACQNPFLEKCRPSWKWQYMNLNVKKPSCYEILILFRRKTTS
ncbi:hypothetical protein Gotur_007271 [Gossypium turneri]